MPPRAKGEKMTVFYAQRNNLGFIIDPGGDVPVEVAPGHYKTKQLQEIKAKWDNHEFDSERFFNNNKMELTRRGWTLEKIDERLMTSSAFGLDFYEVKPPTADEKLKLIEGLVGDIDKLYDEAEKLKPGSGKGKEAAIAKLKEKMVKKAPADYRKKTYRKPIYKCKECGKEFKNPTGMKNHIRMVHMDEVKETANTIL